ncbi:glutathione S-transferase family protein [Mariprofundus sp. EBB-1]|nr:glutathione S-transferase family protein [Mariprofundus sp. EBB-1]RLL50531.1 glutathione S-transferase family protein [Mariprofundus sp. EBB-1]
MHAFTLYHHPLSVCSMKARLALEEKGVAWTSREIDIVHTQEQLEPWYLNLNPKGVVPTLTDANGETKVITNSATIIRYVASLGEGNDLLPASNDDMQRMEKLITLADHIDLQILSYARHPSMEKSEKILDARIEKSIALGKKHPEFEEAYKVCAERSLKNKNFRVDPEYVGQIEKDAYASLSTAESQLAKSSYLIGETYTLADVIWTVVLSRLELLGYDDWISQENFPSIASYYQKMKNRKSFSDANIQNQWWQK